jgi:hypothetical protein
VQLDLSIALSTSHFVYKRIHSRQTTRIMGLKGSESAIAAAAVFALSFVAVISYSSQPNDCDGALANLVSAEFDAMANKEAPKLERRLRASLRRAAVRSYRQHGMRRVDSVVTAKQTEAMEWISDLLDTASSHSAEEEWVINSTCNARARERHCISHQGAYNFTQCMHCTNRIAMPFVVQFVAETTANRKRVWMRQMAKTLRVVQEELRNESMVQEFEALYPMEESPLWTIARLVVCGVVLLLCVKSC